MMNLDGMNKWLHDYNVEHDIIEATLEQWTVFKFTRSTRFSTKFESCWFCIACTSCSGVLALLEIDVPWQLWKIWEMILDMEMCKHFVWNLVVYYFVIAKVIYV